MTLPKTRNLLDEIMDEAALWLTGPVDEAREAVRLLLDMTDAMNTPAWRDRVSDAMDALEAFEESLP